MPYTNAKGRYSRGEDIVLHASAAETASANGTAAEVTDRGTVRLLLVISAVAGTNPTLDLTIETSHDNGVLDAWRSVGTIAQQTATTTGVWKSLGGCDRFVRSRSVIGGTGSPSFTYVLSGEAV